MKTPALVATCFYLTAFCLVSCSSATQIMNFGHWTDSTTSPTLVGSGHIISENRPVSGFHGLEQMMPGDVVITQGDQEGLVIEGEDNILPLVETKVDKAGILHLSIMPQAGRISYEKELVFKLSVKHLDQIKLATSGHLQANALTADKLDLRVLSSGTVTVAHLKTPQLTVTIDGSGTIKLTGSALRQSLTVNGSGAFQGRDLRCQDATVVDNGSGKIRVWAEASLDATICGSGEVSYRGSARLTKRITGSGHLRALTNELDR